MLFTFLLLLLFGNQRIAVGSFLKHLGIRATDVVPEPSGEKALALKVLGDEILGEIQKLSESTAGSCWKKLLTVATKTCEEHKAKTGIDNNLKQLAFDFAKCKTNIPCNEPTKDCLLRSDEAANLYAEKLGLMPAFCAALTINYFQGVADVYFASAKKVVSFAPVD